MNSKDLRAKLAVNKVNIGVIFVGGGAGHISVDFCPLSNEENFPSRASIKMIAMNTDAEDLDEISEGIDVLPLGQEVTGGYGAGADPAIGLQAAKASSTEIKKCLEPFDLVVIVVCLGGGTGSGAAPYIAQCFAEMKGALKDGPVSKQKTGFIVATTPFRKQGLKTMEYANAAIRDLKETGIPLVVIDNDKLVGDKAGANTISATYSAANKPIALITGRLTRALGAKHDLQNIDRNDIFGCLNKEYKDEAGVVISDAHFGVGFGSGENAMQQALQEVEFNEYSGSKAENCQGLILSVDKKGDILTQEWELILEFLSKGKHESSIWLYGLNQSYSQMANEPSGSEVVVSVIGVGHIEPSLVSAPLDHSTDLFEKDQSTLRPINLERNTPLSPTPQPRRIEMENVLKHIDDQLPVKPQTAGTHGRDVN